MHPSLSLRARRARLRERRNHDRALADPRVAAEHRIAADRARDRGNPGCPYCDGRPTVSSRLLER